MPIHASRLARAARALLLLAALAPIALHAPARAQGISIGWQDCRSGGGVGSPDAFSDCTPSINPFPFFPAVRPASRVDSVYAMELVIDVDVAADSLPAWWHMEPGGCRENSWTADTIRPLSCSDAWAGLGVASYQGWLPGVPGGSARHGRLLVAAAVLPGQTVALNADVSYSICRVLLQVANPQNCAGCTIPACLVFNSLLIRRLPGSSVEEVFISDSETAGSNMVTWQGVGADCQAVPTRRRTWGAVKALYR